MVLRSCLYPKNGAGISKVNSNNDEIMKMRLNITSKMLIGFRGLVIKAEDYEDHQSKSLTLNHVRCVCVYIGRGGRCKEGLCVEDRSRGFANLNIIRLGRKGISIWDVVTSSFVCGRIVLITHLSVNVEFPWSKISLWVVIRPCLGSFHSNSGKVICHCLL